MMGLLGQHAHRFEICHVLGADNSTPVIKVLAAGLGLSAERDCSLPVAIERFVLGTFIQLIASDPGSKISIRASGKDENRTRSMS